jgi:hypothetical protein
MRYSSKTMRDDQLQHYGSAPHHHYQGAVVMPHSARLGRVNELAIIARWTLDQAAHCFSSGVGAYCQVQQLHEAAVDKTSAFGIC